MAATTSSSSVLAPRCAISAPRKAPLALLSQRASSAGLQIARANGPRVTRVFREAEDGSLVEASPTTSASTVTTPQPTPQGQALYADQVAPRVVKKKDSMSKEMKARLREEYYGLGGSESKVHLPHARQPMVVAIASVESRKEQSTEQQHEQQPGQQQQHEAGTAQQQVHNSKWKIGENENLHSTWEHRAWTWASMSIMAATMSQGISQAHELSDWVGVGAALVVAYVLSDLGTGVYHWSVDNWGGSDTPLVGRQIAAFQGHHQRPWTITEREFCNNVHQVFKPAAFPATLFLLLSPVNSASANVFVSSFIFLVCMSQQFHAWSHMKKSELPSTVVALQDAGVLISRKMHGAHHKPPFSDNYCIVSGLWNPLLDSTGFFKHLERFCHRLTGIEPRSWSEPNQDWQELQRPESL